MVTRRVSEAERQYCFFLANASGYQKCATSKRVSEDEAQASLACDSGLYWLANGIGLEKILFASNSLRIGNYT